MYSLGVALLITFVTGRRTAPIVAAITALLTLLVYLTLRCPGHDMFCSVLQVSVHQVLMLKAVLISRRIGSVDENFECKVLDCSAPTLYHLPVRCHLQNQIHSTVFATPRGGGQSRAPGNTSRAPCTAQQQAVVCATAVCSRPLPCKHEPPPSLQTHQHRA